MMSTTSTEVAILVPFWVIMGFLLKFKTCTGTAFISKCLSGEATSIPIFKTECEKYINAYRYRQEASEIPQSRLRDRDGIVTSSFVITEYNFTYLEFDVNKGISWPFSLISFKVDREVKFPWNIEIENALSSL